MMQRLQKKYALSRQGAKDLVKGCLACVFQNITFSIAVKLAILILSAFGLAGMGFAVFGDVGVAVIAILNAMRVNTKYKIS